MGHLDAERWHAVASHLDRALEMSPEERATWLASMLERDPRLGADLQTLLDEHRALVAQGFLERDTLSLFGPFGKPRGQGSTVPTDQPRYEVGAEHARGGMGRILRATDTYLERPVAIKELLFEDPRAEARFVREAKLTARLEHPSVVPVHDAGRWEASGKLFYSMKLVRGRPLSELVAGAGTLRERLGLVSNVLAVAEAIAYAHSERIIHRDLKPSNVLVGAYGETLVVDWGLAKDLSGSGGDDVGSARRASADGMTVAGTILGTPHFMPPEQARGLEVDERADVYAIGAMLYFVLAGEAPYVARDPDGVLEQVVSRAPPRIAERAPDAPPDLSAIVDKAMARERAERYRNAGELAADLRRFSTGQLVEARTYSWRELVHRWTKRHRAIAWVSAVFVVAALVGTATFVGREQRLRGQAELSRARADAESWALLAEHGRRELGLGRPSRAAVYLAEAYRHDSANRSLQYLVTEAVRPLAAHAHTLLGHRRQVITVAFSPDGASLATGSDDHTVRLWDVQTGQSVRVLQGAESGVEDVAWSPDGKLVASAERAVCVWNAATGALVTKLPRSGLFRLAFSRDGKWLAAGSETGWLYVWDTATWKLAVERRPYLDRLSAIAFHPNGERAVTTSWDGVVTFWALPAWTPIASRADHHNDVGTAAFSADGRWLLTGDREVTLFVRDAMSGEVAHVLLLPEGSNWMSAFFVPDGRSIVTGSQDGAIRVWHAESGALLYAIDAVPGGKLFNAALSPDGQTVATGGLAGADLWRLDRVGGYRILGGTRHESSVVYPAVMSEDGSKVAASVEVDAGAHNRFGIWDTQSGAELASWEDSDDGYALAANSDLTRVAAGGKPAARLWDGATGRLISRLEHGGRRIRALAFRRDGSELATVGDDQAVRFWHAADGAPAGPPITLDNRPTAVAFSPTEPRLAVTDAGGRIQIRDLPSGAPIVEINAHPVWIEAIEYSADGAWLVTAGRLDHTAKVWNARNGELRATLTGHTNNLIRASFSADAALVGTASVDGTARIWDAATGQILRVIHGPSYSARFTPDGRELLTTGRRDYTVVWDVTLDARGPEEIARIVAERSPWRLRDGQLSLREDTATASNAR
ncbi:MAG TPA: protein kinase [Polyangiaceae bacterium]|nr:protein kinase [Polyangiaceae bacterium]